MGAQLRRVRVLSAAADVLPLESCDGAAIGRPAAPYQDWLEHCSPGDPWWDAIVFGRRLERVPPASLVGGWYDLVPAGPAGRLRGLAGRRPLGPPHGRARGRTPSPGLFAETSPRRAASGTSSSSESGGGSEPQGAGAGLRHGVAHLGGVLAVAAGGGGAAVVRSGRWGTLGTTPPAGERPRHGSTTTRTTRRRPSADRRSTSGRRGPEGPAPARAPARRVDLHQPGAHRGPDGHRPADGDAVPAVVARARGLLRAAVRRDGERASPFNLSDGIVQAGARVGAGQEDRTSVFRLEVAMWPTANTFRAGHRIRLQVSSGAHPLFCRNAGSGRAARDGRHPALGRSGGLPRRRAARRAITLHVVRLLAGAPLGEGAEWVLRTPSASLARMTQPTFVPIAEADQVRPARHLHVPGPWTTSRPAEAVGAVRACRAGRGDAGARLRASPCGWPARFEDELELRRARSEHDVAGSAWRSSRPSGRRSFGRAPSIYDVQVALACGGSSDATAPEAAERRRAAFAAVVHDYAAQRRLADGGPGGDPRSAHEVARATGAGHPGRARRGRGRG